MFQRPAELSAAGYSQAPVGGPGERTSPPVPARIFRHQANFSPAEPADSPAAKMAGQL